MNTLSVVIPAYNEEAGIAPVIERVLATRPALAQVGFELEFIVVDDGSRDHTAAQVGQYRDVHLVRHLHNHGYGAAIKTGFRQATGSYLAFLDADGTYPPECLPALCHAALEQDADMVVGSRMAGSKSEMPLTRRLGNFLFASLLTLVSNVRVRDTSSGMRVLRKSVLECLYPLPDGLQFTPAMSTRAIHENLKIVEVPIPYAERLGRSKLSVVRDGVRFTNAIIWTALTYNPVRILGLVSLAALGIALLIALYFLVIRLSGVTALNSWQVFALYSAVMLAVLGINLFSLGSMFNYLVSLFHKRPVRQGLFGKPLFNPSLDHQFGWLGLVAMVGGVLVTTGAFVASVNGLETERLWFYLLLGAMFFVTGLELFISWIVMRVLEELAGREVSAHRDLLDTAPVQVEPTRVMESRVQAN